MAGTEPAIVATLVWQRNAAEMRANASNNEPLFMPWLDTLRIRRWIPKAMPIDRLRELDIFCCTMKDEDRLASPKYFYDLTFGDWRQINIDWAARRNSRRVRIHLRN